jgi:hypothetical protein
MSVEITTKKPGNLVAVDFAKDTIVTPDGKMWVVVELVSYMERGNDSRPEGYSMRAEFIEVKRFE